MAAYRSGGVDINSNLGATLYDGDIYTHRIVSPLSIEGASSEIALYLRPTVLLHLILSRKSNPAIIKTHSANIAVGGFELFPDGMTEGAIHLVRDPRDVCVSFAKHLKQNMDMTVAMMGSKEALLKLPTDCITAWLGSWSSSVKSWEGELSLRVRYEDLQEDAIGWFRKVVQHVGWELDEERLKLAVELCKLDKLKEQENKNGFIENGKHEKFFGQGKGWKNELTDKQARRIEEDHGEVMEELGYKLEYL